MKKTKFENPELLIILFNNNDIILTSGEEGDEWDENWPIKPGQGN